MSYSRLSATFLLFLSCISQVHGTTVLSVRSYRAPEYTRLVFDLDSTLEHQVFMLEGPDRVVVDLENSKLSSDLGELEIQGTPISSVRTATRNNHDVRVVFDMNSKVQPRSFMLGRNEQYGDRLVIDLYDEGSNPDSLQAQASAPAANSASSNQQPILSANASEVENSKRDIVIAISAGHGGEDPGAIGVNRLQEKRVVLEISREVTAMINSIPGYKAIMIRDGDYYVGLRQQINIAHEHSADLFVAIHADAHSNSSAQGSTIYALSQRGATSEQAQRLAQKENSADLIGGVGSVSISDKDQVLASVLLDLSMTATVATSLEIGDSIIGALQDVVKMRRTNVEQAAFVVLKSADIPSLLIESGYVTNPRDAKNLDSKVWRQRFAGAVTQGITGWFYERPPRGTWVAWAKENGASTPGSYTVRRGDSLSQIAQRFNISVNSLKAANKLRSNTINVGQKLTLPDNTLTLAPVYREHTISRGETLSQIASSYAIPLDVIRQTNQLKSDKIRVGQVLKIPTT